MQVITRFAPSPTGLLHIGGARTALFNWLLARHYGGKFLLRIEDTDRERSTPEAIEAIFAGLKWLGIKWDDEPVFQFARQQHHVALAKKLVEEGKAYYCYCSPEELELMRQQALARGESPKYNGKWRDRDISEAPDNVKPVIRLKTPQTGTTELHDLVQGTITVENEQLDDMILVRSDGTPTFMLSVVVDDHDMGITHIIRGDDHLTNTFRHIQIYEAFGWKMPQCGHVPLVLGSDGAKLSKRHGALGIQAYRDMGYLPEAVCNCLLRLGWSHGDDEIISYEQAIEWFTTDNLGKSAARLDFKKMENLNAIYMRKEENDKLIEELQYFISPLTSEQKDRLMKGMNGLKQRAKTLIELAELSKIYTEDYQPAEISNEQSDVLNDIYALLLAESEWSEAHLETSLRDFAQKQNLSFGKVAQPLRAALTHYRITPGIFEMLFAFGRDESLRRIQLVCAKN